MDAAEGPRDTVKLPTVVIAALGVAVSTLMAFDGLLSCTDWQSLLELAVLLVYVRLWYARTCNDGIAQQDQVRDIKTHADVLQWYKVLGGTVYSAELSKGGTHGVRLVALLQTQLRSTYAEQVAGHADRSVFGPKHA
jgi:hypothetical protein